MFNHTVTTLDQLVALVGEPGPIALRKQLDRLDMHCRTIIGHAPYVLMATAHADGRCDVSPKGDEPGFVHVLDDRHLVIPDRPGNRRLDGMRNILTNPQIGLLFVVPGYGETLRINGRAVLTTDPALLATLAAGGKTPMLALGVTVEEVFLHCAKAARRAALWQPERWSDPATLPTAAQVFHDHARPEGTNVAEVARVLDEGYRTRLY